MRDGIKRYVTYYEHRFSPKNSKNDRHLAYTRQTFSANVLLRHLRCKILFSSILLENVLTSNILITSIQKFRNNNNTNNNQYQIIMYILSLSCSHFYGECRPAIARHIRHTYRVNLKNVPSRKLRYLRNARIFLYQILLICLQNNCAKVCCFVRAVFTRHTQIDGNAKLMNEFCNCTEG